MSHPILLARHGANPSDLDTVYVVLNYELPNELLLSRSDAVLFVLKQLGGPWPPAAFLLQLLPNFLRNSAYNFIASYRYRLFGRSETCMLPREEDQSRFLDI